jgi:hypothetical protein
LPASGSAPLELGALTDQAWPGVSLSNDGRTYIYSRLDHRDSNLVAAVSDRRP